MKKIFTIAAREYRAMVGTKAFLISILMMPVLMVGSLVAMELLRNSSELKERKIAVIDSTGQFFDSLNAVAEAQADTLKQQAENGDSEADFGSFSKEYYVLELVTIQEDRDALLLELSDRVRNQDLYAFVEIPAGTGEEGSTDAVRFYGQDASISEARGWIARLLNQQLQTQRLQAADIDPQLVQQASRPVNVKGMSLVEMGEDGTITSREENSPLTAIFLPLGVMMLMFMVIFMSAQPMLESVLEEKSQRIAEVLLGSVNSFQLMSGKLLGTVAGSLTVFGIYLAGMLAFAFYKGYDDQIPFDLIPWFIVFQIMGVLLYASIFLAIGASVSQLKEAQSMLLPVWMLMMSPMFVWLMLVREPQGKMAMGFSLFPPATPTAMMLRMATGQTIPIWQPILGAVLTGVTTIFIVYVAARIFRVGILWQGKTPKIGEVFRWAFRG